MLGSFRAAVAKVRREQSLLFASLLSEESILEAFGSARWLWQGWNYGPPVTIWVFLSQCLSMDHSCRDAVARLITWRVARGLRSLLGGHWCLLHRSGQSPGAGLPPIGSSNRDRLGARGSHRVALAQAARARGRRLDDHDAGHAGQPGRVSADGLPETGLRFSHRPHCRRFLVVGRNGARSRARKVWRQADGGEQPVSHASALSGHWRCRGG